MKYVMYKWIIIVFFIIIIYSELYLEYLFYFVIYKLGPVMIMELL